MTAEATVDLPPRGLSGWWGRLGTGARVAVTFAVAVAAVNAVGFGLRELVGTDPGGPASSAFGTAEDGYGALARLAERSDRTVVRLRVPLDEAALPADLTLVVAEPETFSAAEVAAAQTFVLDGGRLIAIGDPELFEPLVEGLSWSRLGTDRHAPLLPTRAIDLGDVTDVRGDGSGSWEVDGPWLSVLGSDDRTTVAMSRSGNGTIIAIADATVWNNDNLADAGNAAFALGAFGPADQPVVFAEAAHGQGGGGGIGAAPHSWRWAAALSLVAVLVLFWSRARAFGPPDRDDRLLEPPRRLFAESLALTLGRTGDHGAATEPLRVRGLAALAHRAGAAGRELEPAGQARAVGLADADAALLTRPPTTESEAIALGRLVARLETPVSVAGTASSEEHQ